MSEPIGTQNPYIMGNPEIDRYRLETQTRLFEGYVRNHARAFCGDNVTSILDLGGGEGQLGFVLKSIYPAARLVGIDSSEPAIERARARAKELGLADTEFIVGDVESDFPAGPFDLIYASAILSHTHNPPHIVALAFTHLNPGGHFWVKDFDSDYFDYPPAIAYLDGDYVRMVKLLMDAIGALGGHPYYLAQLSDWLKAEGFVNIRRERETMRAGGPTAEGMSGVAIGAGAFYNARTLISRTSGIPENQLIQLYTDVINKAMASKAEGEGFSGNVIATKPPAGAAPAQD
jgi:ubiquinone/menaquinone biosynthesis C-methylase UbiE